MVKEAKLFELEAGYKFFKKSISTLTESDSKFAPAEGLMTVAQQIAHVAQTFNWFIDGAFSGNGFNMDMEKLAIETNAFDSLEKAMAFFEKAYSDFHATIKSKTDQELLAPLEDKSIMGDAPCVSIVNGVLDHTAHHRGVLTVYARLTGKTPPMPYMD